MSDMREARAANGHLMVYEVIPPTTPDGEERWVQHSAQHSANCSCHDRDEDPWSGLPDY
jgi:hypothetical protein